MLTKQDLGTSDHCFFFKISDKHLSPLYKENRHLPTPLPPETHTYPPDKVPGYHASCKSLEFAINFPFIILYSSPARKICCQWAVLDIFLIIYHGSKNFQDKIAMLSSFFSQKIPKRLRHKKNTSKYRSLS